jgi:hypothetical protein
MADVIYYIAYRLFGLNGVVLLTGILIASTFGLLYIEAVSQNNEKFLSFLLILLGTFVTSIHWVARPHLFTMLFLALWLIFTERLARGIPVQLWIFPALMLLWANMHAEFIAGFLILFAYLAGGIWQFLFTRTSLALKTIRHLLVAALLSLAASIVTPTGPQAWDTVLGYLQNRYLLSHIAETRPPNFTQAEYLPLLILLGISVLLLAIQRRKFTPAQFFLMAGFGLMSFFSARNVHLFGVIAPITLANGVQGISASKPLGRIEAAVRQMESQAAGRLQPILLTILASVILLAGSLGKTNRFEPSMFPVQAVEWLEVHPQTGRMFNAFDWGGYLLFHLWPAQKVFIESQTDVSGEVTKEYETVVTLREGWQDIFERHKVTWVIVPPDWPLARELHAQGWKPIYRDDTTVILHKP